MNTIYRIGVECSLGFLCNISQLFHIYIHTHTHILYIHIYIHTYTATPTLSKVLAQSHHLPNNQKYTNMVAHRGCRWGNTIIGSHTHREVVTGHGHIGATAETTLPWADGGVHAAAILKAMAHTSIPKQAKTTPETTLPQPEPIGDPGVEEPHSGNTGAKNWK